MRPRPSFSWLTTCLAVTVLVLAGCHSTRVPATSRASAAADANVRQVRVVTVWDQVEDRVEGVNDPNISHVIEVDVLAGKNLGDPLTLPYDSWNVGKPPPVPGSIVTMCPADWVRRDPRSAGRPFGE